MEGSREELFRRLLETFKEEASEHIGQLQTLVERLRSADGTDARTAALESAFRVIHTLKGAARAVGVRETENLCHALETFLADRADGRERCENGDIDLFQDAIAALSAQIDGRLLPDHATRLRARLEGTGSAREPEGAAEPVSGHPDGHPAPPRRDRGSPTRPGTVPGARDPDGSRTLPEDTAAAADHPRPVPASGPDRRRVWHRPEPRLVEPPSTIRMAAARLDGVAAQVETLVQPADEIAGWAAEARDLLTRVGQLRRLPGLERTIRSNEEGSEKEGAVLTELEGAARQLRDKLLNGHRNLRSTLDGLLAEVRAIRMTPISWIIDGFPAMVADLAAEDGKRVRWTATGGETQVDRRILEQIKDPLIHLVRNAVSHGVEPAAERRAAGKPEVATVSLAVGADDRGWVEITIVDDGRGIDREAVHRAAGMVAGAIDDRPGSEDAALLDLICRSGLSTSRVLTEISGRGLGMAIVRERIEGLDGTLALASRAGEGTSVSISVPSAMSLFSGLHVRCGDRGYLLPIRSVAGVSALDPASLGTVRGRSVVEHGDRMVPVANLEDVLGLPGPPSAGPRKCVIMDVNGRFAGILVDELRGRADVVLRPLGPPLDRVRHVAAAAQLSGGEAVLSLRPADLVRHIERVGMPATGAVAADEPGGPRTILVVDDSVTTRVMEKNLLEAAGYDVRLAADGVEALEILTREPIDIVVSDIDMPHLDGVGLTRRIRATPTLCEVPVILVTALDTPEDKQRGLEAGASAYMVKAQFDESMLLDLLRRVV